MVEANPDSDEKPSTFVEETKEETKVAPLDIKMKDEKVEDSLEKYVDLHAL